MFESNVQSKWEIRWNPVIPECFAQVCAVLEKHFGISGIQSIKQVDEWEQMSNNFCVICSSGRFLVRKNIISSLSEIEASTLIIQFLHEKGVVVPRLVYTIDGRSIAEYANRHWQVFDFIPGNHFRGTDDELAQSVQHIAAMHHTLKQFPRADRIPGIESVMGSLRIDYNQLGELSNGRNSFERTIIAQRADLDNLERITNDALRKVGEKRQQVLHGDLHPQNFLFDSGKLVAVLDFGNASFGGLMSDVGMACHRLVRQYVVNQCRPWPETLAKGLEIFLNGYSAINSLDREELRNLPIFIRELLLRKIVRNLSRYLNGIKTQESALEQHEKFLGLIEESKAIERVLSSVA